MRTFPRPSTVAWLCLFIAPGAAAPVTVSVLATTDLHGNILPFDYYENRPAGRGLAKVATLIAQARAWNPNSILIDCGDTIQGTPLEYVYQHYVKNGRLPLDLSFKGGPLLEDPMMRVMNHLGYDAMVLGNHEFNYGLKSLERARRDARFPWLSANTAAPGNPYRPFLLKTVAGVKVAVVGITTPAIPLWEKPENYAGYRFEAGVAGARRVMEDLRAEKPDLVVAAVHAGLERDLTTGRPLARAAPGEDMVYEIAARVKGIDAIVFGHSHQQLEGQRVGEVLLVQPRNWGSGLARLDFELDPAPGGGWKLREKSARLIPVTAQTPADPEVMRLARPYHELAERYLNTVVAESPAALNSALGRAEDTPLVDAVHEVQLHYTGADVSFTALFNPRVSVARGPVTVRQLAALYLYDNELYAVEGDGRMVKEALENAARYYLSCQGAACTHPPRTNPKVAGYNYDMAQGVEYEVDLTQPEGQRIRNLRWKGRPLQPSQKLRIAINNYRAGGSGGYGMFRGARVVWRSTEDIRQLMIDYYSRRGRLPSRADGNWRIVFR